MRKFRVQVIYGDHVGTREVYIAGGPYELGCGTTRSPRRLRRLIRRAERRAAALNAREAEMERARGELQ